MNKSPLVKKSNPIIAVRGVIILISGILTGYLGYVISYKSNVIYYILLAVLAVVFVLNLVFFINDLSKPAILLTYNEDYLFIARRGKEDIALAWEDIDNIISNDVNPANKSFANSTLLLIDMKHNHYRISPVDDPQAVIKVLGQMRNDFILQKQSKNEGK
ncbi:MAG: hypothetical protein WCR67_00835 [Bacilli bacterium]